MYQGEIQKIQTNRKDAPLVQRSERSAYNRLISVQVTYGVPRKIPLNYAIKEQPLHKIIDL